MNRLFFGVALIAQVIVPCVSYGRTYEETDFGPSLSNYESLVDEIAQTADPVIAAPATQPTEPQPIPVPNSNTPPSPTSTVKPEVLPPPSQTEPGADQLPAPTDPALDEPFIEEEMSDLPAVETTELTLEIAKRAVDVYAIVKDKYKDAEIEAYENLQDFVDKNPQGKIFEGDIKSAGFANVNDWNLAITTASFAYTNIIDDQTADIKEQIEEISKDPEMEKEVKDRMVNSLNSMIPSDNNRTVLEALINDPAYAEKVKLLQVEEE